MQETWELLKQGGWSMVPLALCSVIGLTIILERAWALRRGRIVPDGMVGIVDAYAGESSAEPTLHACRRSSSSIAQVLEALLLVRAFNHEQIIDTMQAVGRREVERLERGLVALEVIAGISPLIGLLGTVLGMVAVFDAISVQGLGDAQVLSAGISKALVTTIAGLGVAIPALAFHGYFTKRVESMAIEMQEIATNFSTKLSGPRQSADMP